MNKVSDSFILSNGVSIPCVGFGTWQIPDGDPVFSAVSSALETGYVHIDTAAAYGNEAGVGEAVRRYPGGRENVFVTSKLWNDVRGYRETLDAFDRTMERLGFSYLDLFLIHWPAPYRFRDRYQELNRETWRAFEELYRSGKVRAIGVSNFLRHHLEELMETAEIAPMVDQIEFHPGWMQTETVSFCQQNGIQVEAWSPLGSGKLLQEPKLHAIAEKYGKSPAQLCLRWILQKGILPLPKSVTKERILQNTQLFDFCISSEDVQIMDSLSCVGRTGSDPDNAKF